MKENITKFTLSEEKALHLEVLTSADTKAFIKDNPFVKRTDKLTAPEIVDIFGIGKKPEPFHNEELPQTFQNRTFIKNLAALPYKLEEIPGHIVKYDDERKDYIIVSLARFVKDNRYPEVTVIEDGILYSSKINSEAGFNGSFMIGGLKVDSKNIMELIIQDVIFSIIPDEFILKDTIEKEASKLSDTERKKYFFIRGTTLTIVNNKKYKEQKFDAKVNLTYVTAEGKVYGNKQKFSRERLVSLDLVSLEDIFTFAK